MTDLPEWFVPFIVALVVMVAVVIIAPPVREKIAANTLARAVAKSENNQPDDIYTVLIVQIKALNKQVVELEARLRANEKLTIESDAKYAKILIESDSKYAKILLENQSLKDQIVTLKSRLENLYDLIGRNRNSPALTAEPLEPQDDMAFRGWLIEAFQPGDLVLLAADAMIEVPAMNSISIMAGDLIARARNIGASDRLAALALARRPGVKKWKTS